MANKSLKAARKAYNKSKSTKNRIDVETGNKVKKKKKQETKSHYGQAETKNKKIGGTNAKKALDKNKTSSGVVKAHYGQVEAKTHKTFGNAAKTVSNIYQSNVRNAQKNKANTASSHYGQVTQAKIKTSEENAKKKFGVGTYSTSNAQKAKTKQEQTQKNYEEKGKKKVQTVTDEQLKTEQNAEADRVARATRFYMQKAVINGDISKEDADAEVKKAQKEARKAVKDGHTLEYTTSTRDNEYVQRVANASQFANTKVEDKEAADKARRQARFYSNYMVTHGKWTQEEADQYVKDAGKGHVTSHGNIILDELGGKGTAEDVGTQTAGKMADSKFFAGALQGSSYGDITRGVGKYNKQAAELVDTTKNSGAFMGGYMVGQGAQFALGGTAKMTDALVKGVAKSGAMRSALNIGARKGAADMLFEAPINTLDAIKMSTDANGNFDKNAFVKYMALNSGLSGGMGGVIGGVGNKLVKNDAKTFIRLSEKLKNGDALSPQEIKAFENVQKKLSGALESNDVAKADVATKAKADAVLSKADTKEYLALSQKKNAGKITQQENVRLSLYENVIKQNYKETQDKYAKILADAAAGEKTSIKETKEAVDFFERSGDVVKAQEAETILKNTTKERQLEIIKETNPKDESLGDHTWIESTDDIKTFEEALTDEETGFTPDYTEEMAKKAFEDGEITVYSSNPIEDGAFVTPSKMEAQNYAGSGKVYEQTLKTDDVAWIDNLQGQVAKVNGEPQTKSFNEVFASDKIVKEDVRDYLANAHKEVYENDKDALEIATNAIDNLQKVGRAISNEGGKNSRGERVLADNFSRQFINRGFIDFRGQKVGGIAELAEAMQVFRDPRFETFRIVYMQGDRIVAVDGVSSRMAGFSAIKVGKKTDQRYIAETKQRMKKLNADGYYLVHNHPSGSPDASVADKAETRHFNRHISGFKGHIILDHDSYGIVEASGASRIEKRTGNIGDDLLRTPSVDHPLLGDKIEGHVKAVDVLKQMEDGDNITTIVYVDSKLKITGIEHISTELSRNEKSFSGFIRNRARTFGASGAFMGTKDAKTLSLAENYIKNGTLVDCVHYSNNPYTVRSRNKIAPDPNMVFGKNGNDYIGRRVNETAGEYNGGSFNVFEKEIPNTDAIKSGDGKYMGFNIKYKADGKAEARNLGNEIEVSDKFLALDEAGRKEVLAHEVAHNAAENIEKQYGLGELLDMEIFGKKKVAPEGSQRAGEPYYEGIFGDVGANSLDEPITDSVKYYITNPEFLKKRSPDAYEFIDKHYKKNGFTIKSPYDIPPEEKAALEEMRVREEKATKIEEEEDRKAFAEYKRNSTEYEPYQKIEDLEAEREKIIDNIEGTNATKEQEARLDEIYEEIESLKKEVGAKSDDDFYWKRQDALGKLRGKYAEETGVFEKAKGEKPYAPEPEVPDTSSLPKGVKPDKAQRTDGLKAVTDALTRNTESAEVFSKAEQKEIAKAFDEISANIYNGNLADARRLSEELADKYGKIDEGYKVTDDALWDEVKGAQDYLRDITIHTPEGSGTLKEIKEKYIGDADWHNLHIRKSKNGKMQSQGVDEVWDELVNEFPEVFSREITDPMERLERLAEVSSMRKADTTDMMRYGEEDIASMREDLWTDIYETAQQNAGKFTEPKAKPEVKPEVKETPKAETPKTKPKTKSKKETPAKSKEKPKEPEKTEVQKLHENKFASDKVKTALKDIEDAGVYKEKAEKVAKRFNDLDKKIGAKIKHIENAKKSEKYASEAEKAARVAELEDELKSLENKQAKAAGELEQMSKMKAVDPETTAKEQIKELRGNVKINKELKNTDNLTKTDNWIKDKVNSVRRLWEDSLIDVENTAKASGDMKLRGQILTAANRVRNSMSTANTWITKHRKSFDNVVGGKSLDEIFNKELIENEPKYADFQEYLIMKHVPARHAKGTDIYPEISPELANKRVKELEDKYAVKDKDGNLVLDKNGKPVKSEIEDWAQDVYDYINDIQKYRVDSGMLSKEAADQFAKDYPFYVPTNRVNDEAIDFFSGGVSNGIRSAKGGDNDVLDIYSQLYTATNKTIHAAEENQMLNLYFKAKGVTEEQLKDATLEDLEHAVIEAKVNKKTGSSTVSFFVDGMPVKLPCNHQLALGLREMDGLEFERLMKAAKVATLYGKPFKALVTDWNLVFGVRNGARDLQQALVNSKDTKYFGSSMGAAAHSIVHESSPYRKLYASMGGEQAQLVSYDAVAKQMGIEKQGKIDAIHEKVQEFVDLEVKGKHVNPIHYIEGINGAIEMMPRMCEFIGTIRKEANTILKKNGSSLKQLRKEIVEECNALEKAGKIGQSEISAEVEDRLAQRIIDMVGKDTIDTAMRNANDITLNFGRSGVLGKALNMGFVPYLNPSIQGLSKLVRLFTEAGQEGGWKALASLGMKLGTFTITPAVINELLLKDNEDYQNLNTRDKDNNFFIPLSKFGDEWDGKFLKFPKPRENAVLAEPVEYGLRYFLDDSEYAYFDWDKLKMEDVPLWEKIPLSDEGKQSFRTAIDNIGVINPATSNMFSPIYQTFHNKTWYGGNIESAYEYSINEETGKPNVPVNKRYDTGTSGIAIQLGQTRVAKELNLSPKKIDNILDSYTGMIYDLGISQTTEEAKTRGNWLTRTIASQFVKDSVFSNKLSTNAWARMDGMTKKEQDAYKSTYMYDTFKYDDAMDVITADKNMTNKQKMDAKRALQIKKNKLNREAIDGKPNTSNPLVDIAEHLGATKTLNKFLPDTGGEDTDTWTDYFKTYKNAKGYGNLNKAQKEKESQKFLDVYALGVKGQNKQDPTKFHDSPSWGMTGVAAAQLAKQGKINNKDADEIMKACGVYDSQTEAYHKYAEAGGNVSRYAITEKRVGKTLDKVSDWGMDTKSGLWKGTFDKSMGAKGGTIAMSLATDKKVQFKDRAYYIANSSDPQMLEKMNAARGFSSKYGHKTKEISQLALQADALGDGNTYLKNDEIINVCNKMKGTDEEKSMAYILLGGKPKKNPFGAIGNYSLDGDTGITADDDSSGGHGHGRRGRRRGGGGGGGSGAGMSWEEWLKKQGVGGTSSRKSTKVKYNTSKSALNEAYRKKLQKNIRATHK